MTAETRKRDAGVEKMKENSELKKRISQLEKEVARLQDLHGNYSDIGVQTMTERELGLLPVSDVTVDRLYCGQTVLHAVYNCSFLICYFFLSYRMAGNHM